MVRAQGLFKCEDDFKVGGVGPRRRLTHRVAASEKPFRLSSKSICVCNQQHRLLIISTYS